MDTLAKRPLGCTQLSVQGSPLRDTLKLPREKGVRGEEKRSKCRDPEREAEIGREEEKEEERVEVNWRVRAVSASRAGGQLKRYEEDAVQGEVEVEEDKKEVPLKTQFGADTLVFITLGRVKVLREPEPPIRRKDPKAPVSKRTPESKNNGRGDEATGMDME